MAHVLIPYSGVLFPSLKQTGDGKQRSIPLRGIKNRKKKRRAAFRQQNCYDEGMAKKTRKAYIPAPFFSDWWGPLADQVWSPSFSKHGPTARTRKKHSKDVHRTEKQKCPCEAFTAADLSYQKMSDPDRLTWKKALKKPGMSAYELYMKEAISALINSGRYPECPSVSGGFSCSSVIPGYPIQDPDFIGHAPPIPEKWMCLQHPTFDCIKSPFGTYDTVEDCMYHCRKPERNECMDCDPKIRDDFTVTCTNLPYPFEHYNQVNYLNWVYGCEWRTPPIPDYMWVRIADPWYWSGGIHRYWPTIIMEFKPGPVIHCNPRGIYDPYPPPDPPSEDDPTFEVKYTM